MASKEVIQTIESIINDYWKKITTTDEITINFKSKVVKGIQQLEKDLEVLEIIRNHSEIKNIWSVAGKGPEYFDTTIHQSIDKEDFKKVKEWFNGSKPNKQ